MRLLLLIAMMVAGCCSSYRPSPHRPTSRWSLADDATVLHGIESLTPAQARGVAMDRVGTLYLPDLRTIDKKVASALAGTKASSLHLCGLEDLDAESATELARYRSHGDRVLCLDGLVQARPEVLEALAKTESWGLSLNGLRELDESCIRALASRAWEFAHLELGGIRRFNEQAAAELRFLKVKFCYLTGVEDLSLVAAEALVKADIQDLNLTGLRKIDSQVAAVLAAWEREGKSLAVCPSVRLIIDQAKPR